MTGSQPQNGTRSALLDAVRGVAILQVLIWHYWVPGFARSELPGMHLLTALLNLSWTGVDLFFVLSGFLIGGILIDHRQDANLLSVFYGRRVLRILPLYALVLVPFLLNGADAAISYATFTQNVVWAAAGHWGPQWIGVTWSLAVEEQFYLVLPALIRLVPPARLPIVLLALIALAPVARLLAWLGFGNPYASYMLMPCRMDALFAGVIVAWLSRQPHMVRHLLHNTGPLRAVIGISGAGVLLLLTSGGEALSPPLWSIGYTVIACFYAALLLELTLRPPDLPSPIHLLGGFGLRAYGIYLLHRPVEIIVERLIATGLLGLIAATGLTLIAAALSWRLIEQPCISLGHRFFRYRRAIRAAPLPA